MRTVRRIALPVGIIGSGYRRVCKARGLAKNRSVRSVRPQTTADLFGVELVPLEVLLKEADYVSVHTSLTDETRHLINEERLKLMKPNAMLVNTSRGPVVDGGALVSALQSGVIEAAALDVTEVEPIESRDPLLHLPNANHAVYCWFFAYFP